MKYQQIDDNTKVYNNKFKRSVKQSLELIGIELFSFDKPRKSINVETQIVSNKTVNQENKISKDNKSNKVKNATTTEAPQKTNIENENFKIFTFKGKSKLTNESFDAQMIVSDGKYIVLNGSVLVSTLSATLNQSYSEKRNKAKLDGRKLLKNVDFTSPSTAASFVCGSSRSGNCSWLDEEGKSLAHYSDNLKTIYATNFPTNTLDRNGLKLKIDYHGKEEGGIVAFGLYYKDKFIVLKGSKVNDKIREYSYRKVIKHRNKAKINENNILLEDIEFNSPSTAGLFITGKSCNGRETWKLEDGRTLKEYQESQK